MAVDIISYIQYTIPIDYPDAVGEVSNYSIMSTYLNLVFPAFFGIQYSCAPNLGQNLIVTSKFNPFSEYKFTGLQMLLFYNKLIIISNKKTNI